MPGPPRWRTPLLVGHMLSCQKVLDPALDESGGTLGFRPAHVILAEQELAVEVGNIDRVCWSEERCVSKKSV